MHEQIIEIYRWKELIGRLNAIVAALSNILGERFISELNSLCLNNLGKTWDGRIPVQILFRDPSGNIIKKFPLSGLKYGIQDSGQ